MRERTNMTDVRCTCGAVGRILPPDFDYGPRDVERQLMQWRGGRVGPERVAIEVARRAITACPACQHRVSVYHVVLEEAAPPRVHPGMSRAQGG